jgi:hypothetical protein
MPRPDYRGTRSRATSVATPVAHGHRARRIPEVTLSHRPIKKVPPITTEGAKKAGPYARSLLLRRPDPQRTFPDHFYIDVSTIARLASTLVMLICLFALLLYVVTGFIMIDPLIATITIIGCVGFYLMGAHTRREYLSR